MAFDDHWPDALREYADYTTPSVPYVNLGRLVVTSFGAVLVAFATGVADVVESTISLVTGGWTWISSTVVESILRLTAGRPVREQLSGAATWGSRRIGGLDDAITDAFAQLPSIDGPFSILFALAIVASLGLIVAQGVDTL